MNSITVSGTTIDELKQNISKMAALLNASAPESQTPTASLTTEAPVEAEPPKPKAKVKKADPKPEPVQEAPAAPTAAATKEDAIKALQAVNVQKGIEAAREILSQFKVKRLTEMEPGNFGAFIEACQKVIA